MESSSPAMGRAPKPAPGRRHAAAASRTPVDRILPRSVILTLKHHVRAGAEVSAKRTRELDERFGIEKTYGISVRRLRTFLKRIQPPAQRDPPDPGNAEAAESSESWQHKLQAHRERQASVAAILDATFGQFAKSHPKLWEHRTYLMLVGLVYEQLAREPDELSTTDLLTLAKVLESSRRGRTDRHTDDRRAVDGHANGRANAPAKGAPLPKRFADVVRQVYGTNFQQTP